MSRCSFFKATVAFLASTEHRTVALILAYSLNVAFLLMRTLFVASLDFLKKKIFSCP